VIQIHNLDGSRKVQLRLIPDPFGSIPSYHWLVRTCPASPPGFRIQSASEFIAVRDGTHLAGGSFVADGIAFFVDFGLSEHAAQLRFPGVGEFAILLAGTAFTFLAHHRNPRAIHLQVENGNPRPDRDGSIQLQGALEFPLLAPFDIFPDRLGCALDCFGGHRQTCQQLHWLSSLIQSCFLAHPG
jgi:hypothetical protein